MLLDGQERALSAAIRAAFDSRLTLAAGSAWSQGVSAPDRMSRRIGTAGRWHITAFVPMIHHMTPVMQILDGDSDSLELRITRALAALGGDTVTVSRFTVWYTSRPPVHGAVLRRAADERAA